MHRQWWTKRQSNKKEKENTFLNSIYRLFLIVTRESEYLLSVGVAHRSSIFYLNAIIHFKLILIHIHISNIQISGESDNVTGWRQRAEPIYIQLNARMITKWSWYGLYSVAIWKNSFENVQFANESRAAKRNIIKWHRDIEGDKGNEIAWLAYWPCHSIIGHHRSYFQAFHCAFDTSFYIWRTDYFDYSLASANIVIGTSRERERECIHTDRIPDFPMNRNSICDKSKNAFHTHKIACTWESERRMGGEAMFVEKLYFEICTFSKNCSKL